MIKNEPDFFDYPYKRGYLRLLSIDPQSGLVNKDDSLVARTFIANSGLLRITASHVAGSFGNNTLAPWSDGGRKTATLNQHANSCPRMRNETPLAF